MGEPKQIDDLVVLGRAAPEPIQDGRETVCLGGYSPTEGWIRLYPTKRRMTELQRWNIVSVPVEHEPSHDSRPESYKIAGSQEDWNRLHEKVEQVGHLSKPEPMKLVDDLAGDCTASLNEEQQSLGMVEPKEIKSSYLEPTDGPGPQKDLSGQVRKGKNDYENKLYVEYRCDGCEQKTPHEQHTIEWGIYRYWDKNENKEGVKDALHLHNDDYKKYFFVGNLNHRRRAYIIISIMRFKKKEMLQNGIPIQEQQSLSDFA